MSAKVFVGNLPDEASSSALRSLFEERVGAVKRAWICRDVWTGRSRGFGFVDLEVDADAERAVERIHGSELDGHRLAVSRAVATPPRKAPALSPEVTSVRLTARGFSCVPSSAVRPQELKVGI